MSKRKKYYVIWLGKQEGTYTFLKKRRISSSTENVRFIKGKAKPIKIQNPSYIRGLKVFYFLNVEEGQLSFNKVYGSVDPQVLDMVLKQSIVKQLTSALTGSLGIDFMSLIVGLCVGGIAGFIGGGLL